MNVKMIAAAVFAGLMTVGCDAKEEQKKDEMAVSVNGVKLMQSAIDADVEKVVKAQGDKIPAEQLENAKRQIGYQVVQSFLIEQVVVAKAKEAKLAVTDADRKAREEEFLKAVAKMPDAPKSIDEYFKKFPLGVERARAEFENGILIDKLIKAEQAKTAKKDYTAEAQKIINNVVSNNLAAAKAEFGEKVAASHILVDSEEKIKELKKELDAVKGFVAVTNKFAELAKANSKCPSASKGGDLGPFGRGQMVKEFDAVAFTIEAGKVSDPVKTQFGWHLVLVTKKFPAKEPTADELAKMTRPAPKLEEVIKHLERQERNAFAQNFIMGKMKAAKIEASEAYKIFLPQAEASAAPVEKPTKK